MSRITKLIFVSSLILVAMFAKAGAKSETVVEVFEIHYVKAKDVEGALRVILSKSGSLSITKAANIIVVRDYANNIEQMRKLLEVLDRRPKNIFITVEFVEINRLEELGADLKWRVTGAGWSVASIPSFTGSKSGAGVDIKAVESSFKGKRKQSLLLMENRPGKIFVGESVPITTYYYQYGLRRGYLGEATSFKNVGTSFVVTASTTRNKKIRLKIAPEVSYYDRGKQSFSVKNAETTALVDDPGTVVIASNESGGDTFSSNFLRNYNKKTGETKFVMILKARSE